VEGIDERSILNFEERDAGPAADIGGDGEFRLAVAVRIAAGQEEPAREAAENAGRPDHVLAGGPADDANGAGHAATSGKGEIGQPVAVEIRDGGPDDP